VHQEPYDFLRYTEFMLHRLFSQSGFKKIEIEKIGNIFDLHAQVSLSLFKLLSRKAGNNILKRKLITVLHRLSNFYFRFILNVLSPQKDKREDTIGYPQGYGCVAVKNEI
jgi:hypothetical protein